MTGLDVGLDFGGVAGGTPRGCETSGMRITVLAGGVGGARFLRGLKAAAPDAEITVVGKTGDDIELFGLHVSPDLDTVMYTLGGGISEEQGWGRADETFTVLHELAAYGAGPDWFGLGDRDFATHIVRTSMLRDGIRLSGVTAALCKRWQPGVTLLPMTDDRVQTHVELAEKGDSQGGTGSRAGGRRTVHFQEWWVRLHAEVPATQILFAGADAARPAPGVLEAIGAADCVRPLASAMSSSFNSCCIRSQGSECSMARMIIGWSVPVILLPIRSSSKSFSAVRSPV